MRRTLRFVCVAVLAMLAGGGVCAQADPFLGTWKLNTEKSKFAGNPAPRSGTRTIEAAGKGEKATFQGVAADGSMIDFTLTSNLDGKPVPISGTGIPGGADTETATRINSHTHSATLSKGGKVIAHTRIVVSADGKTTTLTRTMTDSSGNTTTQVLVWEKQ